MNKTIKSVFLGISIFLVSVGAKAQLLPISLGLKGGVNASNTSFKNSDARVGFNAGLTLDVNLPANFVILTGVDISSKGGNIERALSNDNVTKFKSTAMYLQLPVKLGYRLPVLPGLGFHFGAGAYFAQGIAGKTKYTLNGVEEKVNTFSDEGFKKSDWGLGVEVGATVLSLLQIRLGYDFGLVNISQDKNFDIKNRNFYASVGIKFF